MHIIVQFLNGNADHTITSASGRIQQRFGGAAHCSIVTVPFANRLAAHTIELPLRNALVGANAESRIYLRGHGSWQFATLGGWTATQVAATLMANGLHQARVISVTGCAAGRGAESGKPKSVAQLDHAEELAAATQAIQHSAQSFAGLLHASPILCLVPHIRHIRLTARTQYVDVDEAGHVRVVTGSGHGSLKPGQAGARHTKVVFYWEGNTQRVRWALEDGAH